MVGSVQRREYGAGPPRWGRNDVDGDGVAWVLEAGAFQAQRSREKDTAPGTGPPWPPAHLASCAGPRPQRRDLRARGLTLTT